ncbi:MAG: hypothetical protein NT169_22695 [Chloroflexi bacterium]|nr:hypothetical protein [Chloroflexota bacterium]
MDSRIDLLFLAQTMLSNQLSGSSPPLSLEQFKQLYRNLERLSREQGRSLGRPGILLLTRQALVRFPTFPDYSILIVAKRGSFHPQDFEIVLDKEIEGNVKPVTARAFAWTELRNNGALLVLVAFTLWRLLTSDSDLSATTVINQMLVEANAVFISIFVLFTVGQNRDYLVAREFVRKGMAHQFIQNDQYVAWLSIMSLLFALASTAVGAGARLGHQAVTIPVVNVSVNQADSSRIITTIAVLLLIDCFLAITRYYLRLMTGAVERKMIKDWLGKPDTLQATDSNSDAAQTPDK